MDDLISRKALIDYVKAWQIGCGVGHDQKTFINAIDEQPTAFNVEAVVKELEELKLNEILDNCPMKRTCANCEYSDSKCKGCYTGRAIEIVRRGGVK